MIQKGNLANLKANIISKAGEATPTKISVQAFDINPYLHEFFEPIDSIFSWTIQFIFQKGNLAKSEKEQNLQKQ